MKLSERLLDEAEGYGPGPTTFQADEVRQLATLLREAAALAKSVESAPVGEVVSSGSWTNGHAGTQFHVDVPSPKDSIVGGRVALVPLPQQSET